MHNQPTQADPSCGTSLENREVSSCPQDDLFASLPEPESAQVSHPALSTLADLDPDAMTPREAMEAWYALKKQLG